MPMIKQKLKNYHSYKTLNTAKMNNKKIAFITKTIRFVKPAIEDIENGNVITMEKLGVWLDELSAEYE